MGREGGGDEYVPRLSVLSIFLLYAEETRGKTFPVRTEVIAKCIRRPHPAAKASGGGNAKIFRAPVEPTESREYWVAAPQTRRRINC